LGKKKHCEQNRRTSYGKARSKADEKRKMLTGPGIIIGVCFRESA